jgi:hypothetical protein
MGGHAATTTSEEMDATLMTDVLVNILFMDSFWDGTLTHAKLHQVINPVADDKKSTFTESMVSTFASIVDNEYLKAGHCTLKAGSKDELRMFMLFNLMSLYSSIHFPTKLHLVVVPSGNLGYSFGMISKVHDVDAMLCRQIRDRFIKSQLAIDPVVTLETPITPTLSWARTLKWNLPTDQPGVIHPNMAAYLNQHSFTTVLRRFTDAGVTGCDKWEWVVNTIGSDNVTTLDVKLHLPDHKACIYGGGYHIECISDA